MWIRRLELRNVGIYDHLIQTFDRSLVGIVGPNGGGKSTMLKAIYAALTNDFSRFPGNKSGCVRNNADHGAQSRIVLEVEHELPFRIVRQLQPKLSNELTIGGGKPVTGAGKIREELENLLGINKHVLSDYVFVDQWRLFSFLGETTSNRAKALQNLCGLSDLEKVRSALTKEILDSRRSTDPEENVNYILQRIGEDEYELKTLKKEIEELELQQLSEDEHVELSDLIDKSDEVEAARKRLEQLKTKRSLFEETLQRLSSAVNEWSKDLAEHEKHLKELEKDEEQAKETLRLWKTHEEKLKDWLNKSDRLLQLKHEYAKYESLPNPEERDRQLEVVGGCMEFLHMAAETIETGSCGLCRQSVQPTYADALEDEMGRVDELVDATRLKLSDLTKLQEDSIQKSKIGAAISELSEIVEQKPERPPETKESCEKKIRDAKEKRKFVQLKGRSLQRRMKVADKTEYKLKRCTKRIDSLERKILENAPERGEVTAAKDRLQEDDILASEISNRYGRLHQLSSSLKKNRKQVDEARKRAESDIRLNKYVELLSEARELFHHSNLPALISKRFLSQLEYLVNENLKIFGEPFYVRAHEELTFEAIFPDGRKLEAKALSGGELVLLALAVRRGVNSIFASEIGMICLDEPTAGLDSDNVDNLIDYLKIFGQDSKNKGSQILLVTHEENLQPAFDQVVRVSA